MKFQPKRFVVEVKRGTSRAAFSSPDTVSEKFSSAESTLFGGTQKPVHTGSQSAAQTSDKPRGRILESLIEPPAPTVEELPARPRRGRKPGSKNKPKLVHPVAVTVPTPVPARGSFDHSTSPGRVETHGFGEAGPSWRDHVIPSEAGRIEPRGGELRSAAAPEERATEPAQKRRTRLRDRSTILKRYVLGLEPRPGQPGSLRARKLARASR